MDEIMVTCPYCGKDLEIYIEEDVRGSFVQDCEVCCNPWLVRVSRSAEVFSTLASACRSTDASICSRSSGAAARMFFNISPR